ncbi:hypothetical protein BS47DRAFT_1391329 [Hydnum rufescens UP504]|uniref:Uncharacterized protein n=1 Tax=Hydnum rufescens UP504 TaxID=1448309 RepID=A0A9P6DY73_9AGAM|nr:hypothetical protein BS47DRAFT_1391329 [Hydnum rufescens UP504]
MPPKTYQARKRTTRPAATPAGQMARSSTITDDTTVPSTSSESASGPQTRESSDTTGKASSTPITCPVPQCNEWFIDVPSLRSHQQMVQLTPPQSRNHPSVPTSIPYSSNPAGHSPSPAGSPAPFPGLSRAQSPCIHHAQSRNHSHGHPHTWSPAQSPAQAATWSP